MALQTTFNPPSPTAMVLGHVTQTCEDFEPCGQAAKMIGHGLAAFNLYRTNAFLTNIELPFIHFAECIKARNFVGRINQLITGEAWGWKEDKDAAKRGLGTWSYNGHFNTLKFGSNISLLAADLCDPLKFLDRKLDFIKISRIAANVGRIPLFGRIVMLPLERFQSTCAIVGFIFTIADTSREIAQEGFSTSRVLKVAESMMKIAQVVLFTAALGNTIVMYTFYALIASSTASLLYVVRYAVDHPRIYYV